MENNSQNSGKMAGMAANSRKSPENPLAQFTVTAFSHLPEKTVENTPFGPRYGTNRYPPIHEDALVVLEVIRSERFKDLVMEVRNHYGTPQYQEKKKDLPIILFNGVFSEFSKAGFTSPSGLFILDFDHIPQDKMDETWEKLITNEYVFSSWLSPSGHGYKALVKVLDDDSDDTHKEYFKALSESPLFPIEYIDRGGNDICRACFFSSDPNLYLNENSKVWTTRKTIIATPSLPSTPTIPINLGNSETEKIIHFLEGGWDTSFPMTPGSRHDSTFFRSREMAEWGISEDEALSYMLGYAEPDFLEDEITKQVHNAYEKTKINNKIGIKYRKL